MGNPGQRRGRIIFLNGTSSSGKSSIADALLDVLDQPWFHMSVDAINSMRAKNSTLQLAPGELEAVLARTRAGFHRAVAGMAEAGNDVIVDHVLSEQWRLTDCLRVLDGYEVVFVAVRCSAEELSRREHARGDREAGQAAAQGKYVHAHGIYDLECDTTATSPVENAIQIKEFMAGSHRPDAFDRLRSALLQDQRPGPKPAANNS
ncbi:MAG: chloramphenicol phosphotransferase CPT family protein [Nocardiopsaceae bacterium]|nr:chloramphenicol phosphotransferase CPT family protein [Nocardiopsaceae bacterium]